MPPSGRWSTWGSSDRDQGWKLPLAALANNRHGPHHTARRRRQSPEEIRPGRRLKGSSRSNIEAGSLLLLGICVFSGFVPARTHKETEMLVRTKLPRDCSRARSTTSIPSNWIPYWRTSWSRWKGIPSATRCATFVKSQSASKPKPNRPMASAVILMPSVSSGISNEDRAAPEFTSVPTRPSSRPSTIIATARVPQFARARPGAHRAPEAADRVRPLSFTVIAVVTAIQAQMADYGLTLEDRFCRSNGAEVELSVTRSEARR